jgi:agmatinase
MSDNPFQAAWNFLRMPEELATKGRAAAWVLPVPYESTTCYGAGTRDGPAAIIAASRQVEFYDIELACEPALRYGIHTMNPLAPVHGAPEKMAAVVEQTVAAVLSGKPAPRILAMLGGEHSISPGAVRGVAAALGKSDLVAVQIDAHGDLRDSYEGSTWSHACAARRILDVCPVFQAGVRSFSAEEADLLRRRKDVKVFFGPESATGTKVLEELATFVRGKTVYFTIDLDGLDPSIMPAVGTPEPGGLSWERTLEIVRVVVSEAARVPAFDVVELAPLPGQHGPDYLAASLVYKVMSLTLRE